MLPELGLSLQDQQVLIQNVSVVFHSAATVKFDELLKLSVEMNIVGTKRLLKLCQNMVHIKVSLFCNLLLALNTIMLYSNFAANPSHSSTTPNELGFLSKNLCNFKIQYVKMQAVDGYLTPL